VFARFVALFMGTAILLFTDFLRAEDVPLKAVVFVPPRDIEAPLRDALTAQLSGLPVELVIEHFVSKTESLKQDVEESRSMSAAHQAIGVFWLDTHASDEWLVYLAEPASRRLLMRRIPIGPEGSVAAREAVAVIIRESTSALLAGQKIGMTEVAVPDEVPAPLPAPLPLPPAPPIKPAPPRSFEPLHGLSLATSYYADVYAKGSGLSSGVALAGAWTFWNGLHAGVSFVLFQPTEKDAAGVAILVRRYPIRAEAGYTYQRERWSLGGGLGLVAEPTTRHVLASAPVIQPTPDAERVVVFLSPRLRFDYRVTEAMSLFIAAGADFALNGFSFVNRIDGVDQAIFEPLRVRPAGEAGVAFWP
jgi:hypothetical protein